MKLHTFSFTAETDTNAEFTCVRCGTVLGFNKEGIGEPHATLHEGTWKMPEDWQKYTDECTAVEAYPDSEEYTE